MFDELEKQLDQAFDSFRDSMKDTPAFIRFIFFKSIAKRAVEEAKQAALDHDEEMKRARSEFLNMLNYFKEINDDPDDDIEDSIYEESKAEFLN